MEFLSVSTSEVPCYFLNTAEPLQFLHHIKQNLRSSVMLRSLDWQYVTDVLEQSIGSHLQG